MGRPFQPQNKQVELIIGHFGKDLHTSIPKRPGDFLFLTTRFEEVIRHKEG